MFRLVGWGQGLRWLAKLGLIRCGRSGSSGEAAKAVPADSCTIYCLPMRCALQVKDNISKLKTGLDKLQKTRKDVVVLVGMAEAKAKEVEKKVQEADAVAAQVLHCSCLFVTLHFTTNI